MYLEQSSKRGEWLVRVFALVTLSGPVSVVKSSVLFPREGQLGLQ